MLKRVEKKTHHVTQLYSVLGLFIVLNINLVRNFEIVVLSNLTFQKYKTLYITVLICTGTHVQSMVKHILVKPLK